MNTQLPSTQAQLTQTAIQSPSQLATTPDLTRSFSDPYSPVAIIIATGFLVMAFGKAASLVIGAIGNLQAKSKQPQS